MTKRWFELGIRNQIQHLDDRKHMKYLPSYTYSLKSPLDSAEVLKRLKDNVEPKKIIRFDISLSKEPKPFEGSVYSSSFFINKIYYGNYRLRPNIQGKIKSTDEGTQVDIKMAPDMTIWLFPFVSFIILFVYVNLAISGALEEAGLSFKIIFPLFAIFLFPATVIFGYIPKVTSAKSSLMQLFEAKEIPQQAKA